MVPLLGDTLSSWFFFPDEETEAKHNIEDALEHREAGGKQRKQEQPWVSLVNSFPILSTAYAFSPSS